MNISVVIPTLNEEHHIGDCLQSLESQMQSGDEIVVVDGGSDDRTVEMAADFDSTRVFHPDEDSDGPGIGEARHIGTERANNEIIAQTDADSIPPDGWLETIRLNFSNDEELVVLWGSIEDKNGVPIRDLTGKFWTMFGGASGNNTAYRKSAYEELENGYPDWQFAEDFGIIAKLSMKGKAKRDGSMVMQMDMNRDRYQRDPILCWSALSMAIGKKIGGEEGQIIAGSGLGLAGTEMTYETVLSNIREEKERGRSYPHHDEVGVSIAGMGTMMGGRVGRMVSGAGVGIVAHHLVTEGASFMPTELEDNTDEIIGGV